MQSGTGALPETTLKNPLTPLADPGGVWTEAPVYAPDWTARAGSIDAARAAG